MNKKQIFFFLLLTGPMLLSACVHAQKQIYHHRNRTEFTGFKAGDSPSFLPIGTLGVLQTTLKSRGFVFKNNTYSVILTDTAFQVRAEEEIPVPDKLYTLARDLADSVYFQLFGHHKSDQLFLVKTDLVSGKNETLSFSGIEKMNADYLQVLDDILYISGEVKHGMLSPPIPVLLRLNPANGKISTIPLSLLPGDEIVHLKRDSENHRLIVTAISEKNNTKKLIIKLLNVKGEITESFSKTFSSKTELEGRTDGIGSGKWLFSGLIEEDEKAVLLIGGQAGKVLFETQTPLSELKNYYAYLGEEDRQKMEKKKERKEENGKNFSPSEFFLFYPSEQINGEIRISALAYRLLRKYTTQQRRAAYVTYEYDYTHVFSAGFDSLGRPVWDTSAPVGRVLDNLRRFADIQASPAGFRLVFPEYHEKVLFTEALKDNFSGSKLQTVHCPVIFPEDKLSDILKTTVCRHWYGNNYLIFGQQLVRNSKNRESKRRTVWFAARVSPTFGD